MHVAEIHLTGRGRWSGIRLEYTPRYVGVLVAGAYVRPHGDYYVVGGRYTRIVAYEAAAAGQGGRGTDGYIWLPGSAMICGVGVVFLVVSVVGVFAPV